METVIVERSFDKPVSAQEMQIREDAVAWCKDTYNVKFLFTLVAHDMMRMICVYEAPDAEAVRNVQRTGNLPFDRIWTGRKLTDIPGCGPGAG